MSQNSSKAIVYGATSRGQSAAAGSLSKKWVHNVAILASQAIDAGRYAQAISCLLAVIEETEDWVCRYLLACAYIRSGSLSHARHQLLYIANKCPHVTIRTTAREKLMLVCKD
jgi:hypothetical protein